MTYPHERQIEYWTSRSIERFFEAMGHDVLVLPNSQRAEKEIPFDHAFYMGDGDLKIFGLQYKRLMHKSNYDYWKIDSDQFNKISKYDWIYYALTEIRSIDDSSSAPFLTLIVRHSDMQRLIRRKNNSSNEYEIKEQEAFELNYYTLYESLLHIYSCDLGIRVPRELILLLRYLHQIVERPQDRYTILRDLHFNIIKIIRHRLYSKINKLNVPIDTLLYNAINELNKMNPYYPNELWLLKEELEELKKLPIRQLLGRLYLLDRLWRQYACESRQLERPEILLKVLLRLLEAQKLDSALRHLLNLDKQLQDLRTQLNKAAPRIRDELEEILKGLEKILKGGDGGSGGSGEGRDGGDGGSGEGRDGGNGRPTGDGEDGELANVVLYIVKI